MKSIWCSNYKFSFYSFQNSIPCSKTLSPLRPKTPSQIPPSNNISAWKPSPNVYQPISFPPSSSLRLNNLLNKSAQIQSNQTNPTHSLPPDSQNKRKNESENTLRTIPIISRDTGPTNKISNITIFSSYMPCTSSMTKRGKPIKSSGLWPPSSRRGSPTNVAAITKKCRKSGVVFIRFC